MKWPSIARSHLCNIRHNSVIIRIKFVWNFTSDHLSLQMCYLFLISLKCPRQSSKKFHNYTQTWVSKTGKTSKFLAIFFVDVSTFDHKMHCSSNATQKTSHDTQSEEFLRWLDNSTRFYSCFYHFWVQTENSGLRKTWSVKYLPTNSFLKKQPIFLKLRQKIYVAHVAQHFYCWRHLVN